jgi:hypothetical protein
MKHVTSLVVVGALFAAACVDHQAGVTGTQALDIQLITPVDPGSTTNRLMDSARTVVVKVTALDENGAVDTTVSRDVDVYVQFLGTLTPPHEKGVPLTTIPLVSGVSAQATIMLPPVFGATSLWFEDSNGADASFATGASVALWFRDPTISDVQKPANEMSLDALEASPLQNKQISVSESRYPTGRMIVTGVYAQGYTLSDVACADAAGTPPCVAGDYDHAFIFSFSRPKDTDGHDIALGSRITRFTGAVSEFNGLTEIGFPQSFGSTDAADPLKVPAPHVADKTWFTNKIMFERNEAGLIEVDGATVCPLDADYTTYKQWKLDLGSGCGTAINVITSGVVEFDPAMYVGMALPKVIGTLRPINIGTFNVWIMYPRFAADLVTP